MVGYDVIYPFGKYGCVDLRGLLKAVLNDEVAGLMLTNPNTGIFDKNIFRNHQLCT